MTAIEMLHLAVPSLTPRIEDEPGKATLSWPSWSPKYHDALNNLGKFWSGESPLLMVMKQ